MFLSQRTEEHWQSLYMGPTCVHMACYTAERLGSGECHRAHKTRGGAVPVEGLCTGMGGMWLHKKDVGTSWWSKRDATLKHTSAGSIARGGGDGGPWEMEPGGGGHVDLAAALKQREGQVEGARSLLATIWGAGVRNGWKGARLG